jgi:hypothetical protein
MIWVPTTVAKRRPLPIMPWIIRYLNPIYSAVTQQRLFSYEYCSACTCLRNYKWRQNVSQCFERRWCNIQHRYLTYSLQQNNSSITYLLNLLTPWSRVLLEKLTGLQLVKTVPAFYGNWIFITPFTSVRHQSLSWVTSIRSIPQHPTSSRSIQPRHHSEEKYEIFALLGCCTAQV